jgi:hypothetical protein
VFASAVRRKPSIDQRDDLIKDWMIHAELPRCKLNQFVCPLDIKSGTRPYAWMRRILREEMAGDILCH